MVSGTFNFDVGATVDDIVTVITADDDTHLVTEKAVRDYVNTVSGSTEHNELQGLQGGDVGADEFYHLDAADYTNLTTSGTPTWMYYVGADGRQATTSGMTWIQGSGAETGLTISDHVAMGNSADLDLPGFPAYQYALDVTEDFESSVTGWGRGINVLVDSDASGSVELTAVNAAAQLDGIDAIGLIQGGNFFATGSESGLTATNIKGLTATASLSADNATITNSIGGDFSTNTAFSMVNSVYTKVAAGQFRMMAYGSGDIDIVDGYGSLIMTPGFTTTGSGTNLYGLYVEDQSTVGFTNDYNIYSAGANSMNMFEGWFKFDGTSATVEDIVTVITADDDTHLVTEGAVKDYVDTVSGTLETNIIWEVVDTPTDQIRPKAAHMGKAIYTTGNMTLITVSQETV